MVQVQCEYFMSQCSVFMSQCEYAMSQCSVFMTLSVYIVDKLYLLGAKPPKMLKPQSLAQSVAQSVAQSLAQSPPQSPPQSLPQSSHTSNVDLLFVLGVPVVRRIVPEQ